MYCIVLYCIGIRVALLVAAAAAAAIMLLLLSQNIMRMAQAMAVDAAPL
jgi:hypothetical protein